MKRFLLLLLLLPGVGLAQTITELPRWYIYPGNPGEKTLVLPLVDSLATVTAVLYSDPAGRVLGSVLQPTVSKTSPRNVLIRWSGAITSSLALTNPLSYLKISVGGLIRFGVVVDVNTRNVNTTPPGSLTVLYPVAIAVPGAGGGNGGSTQVYYRPGAKNGDPIVHNQGTRLVSVTAFQIGTGVPVPDPLWNQVEIASDASIILRGPPGETCNCTFILTFFQPNPN